MLRHPGIQRKRDDLLTGGGGARLLTREGARLQTGDGERGGEVADEKEGARLLTRERGRGC
jgi:hypothetical protein